MLSSKMSKIGTKFFHVMSTFQWWVLGTIKEFVRMTYNLVQLFICRFKMISEKNTKFGWKLTSWGLRFCVLFKTFPWAEGAQKCPNFNYDDDIQKTIPLRQRDTFVHFLKNDPETMTHFCVFRNFVLIFSQFLIEQC